jgi:hypothetical protein
MGMYRKNTKKGGNTASWRNLTKRSTARTTGFHVAFSVPLAPATGSLALLPCPTGSHTQPAYATHAHAGRSHCLAPQVAVPSLWTQRALVLATCATLTRCLALVVTPRSCTQCTLLVSRTRVQWFHRPAEFNSIRGRLSGKQDEVALKENKTRVRKLELKGELGALRAVDFRLNRMSC